MSSNVNECKPLKRGVADKTKEDERVRAAIEAARVKARHTEEAAEGGRKTLSTAKEKLDEERRKLADEGAGPSTC